VQPGRTVIVFDASELTVVDEAVLDRLAQLRLEARRLGAVLEVRHAPRALVDLLAVTGFAAELGIEVRGQAEAREQGGIDEEVDPRDPAA
jgi:anti-anti-sigma regulatory factor